MRDPYLYQDKEVMKNLCGIMDNAELQAVESDYVTLRLSEIAEDEQPLTAFEFTDLCGMHYRIFQDVFEWAGKPRIINIEKAEAVLNGISVEYSDVFEIKKDAESVLNRMNNFDWKESSREKIAGKFSDYMAELWKVHPFREGNTRTIVTFCKRCFFGSWRQEKTRISLSNCWGCTKWRKRDGIHRIKEAGYSAEKEEVRKVVFQERKKGRKYSREEIGRLLER